MPNAFSTNFINKVRVATAEWIDFSYPDIISHIEKDFTLPLDMNERFFTRKADSTYAYPLPKFRLDHGTNVARIITLNNKHVSLIPTPFTRNFIDAVEIAVKAGADIVNLSIGTDTKSERLNKKRVREHLDKLSEIIKNNPQILFVVAAGNEDIDSVITLGHKNILSVAGIEGTDASVYEHGSYVDLILNDITIKAPSTYDYDYYSYVEGSSFAAPRVTRLAAQVKAQNPSYTPEDIVDALKKMAHHTEFSRGKSKFGVIDKIQNDFNRWEKLPLIKHDPTAPYPTLKEKMKNLLDHIRRNCRRS